MKPRILATVFVTLALTLVLSGGLRAQRGIEAQGTPIGTAFTYQGHLTKNGQPVNGTCDVSFDLYDAEVGGNYVGYDEVTVSVTDGHFSAVVEPYTMYVGESVFNGDARWMSISVRCPAGSGSYTTLAGRVAITAVPYALTVRPGAVVKDTIGIPSTLSVTNASERGVAVYGESTSVSTATDWQAYGGKFVAKSRGGIGVYGENTDEGNFSWGYGVYGKSDSAFGSGVYGENTAAEGYGVYSAGNAHVNGSLTWTPRLSYISIPAAAFGPEMDNVDDPPHYCGYAAYINWGNQLNAYMDSDCPVKNYVAPVQLPHGATVTQMAIAFHDQSVGDAITVTLERFEVVDYTFVEMASAVSVDGENIVTDTAIEEDLIDNSQYTYYLTANLPHHQDLFFYYVIVEYLISSPY